MKAGKSATRDMNSGFGRSGDVHVRKYSASLSSKVAFPRGVSRKTSSSNVRGSSSTLLIAEGEGRGDVEGPVVAFMLSKNGSLDARERFARGDDGTGDTLGSFRSLDNRGCDVARACIAVGAAYMVPVEGDLCNDDDSSNPIT